MVKKSISKEIIKDIIIIAIGVLIIWIGLQVVFGTANPFYVVASGSMIPVLEVHDVLVVQGHDLFEDVNVGDIIVFNRPSDHNRVIVHRVESILDEEPRTIRTKGDANPSSIPGTDYPITEEEYIGKVVYTVPQIGYVTQVLKPPINYVIIAIVIGIMIAKQMIKRKKEDSTETDLEKPDEPSKKTTKELSDITNLKDDSEYTKTRENSDVKDTGTKADTENSDVKDTDTENSDVKKPEKE